MLNVAYKFNRNFFKSLRSRFLMPSYKHNVTIKWCEDSNTHLCANDFIYPVFLSDYKNEFTEINDFPGQYRCGRNKICQYLEPMIENGLKSVILFGTVDNNKKDVNGSCADDSTNPVIEGLQVIKQNFPHLYTICDVCLCSYTKNGLCGVAKCDLQFEIDVCQSIKRLAEISLAYAQAGCDCVAPSDMLDNRVSMINQYLIDGKKRNQVSIMSYSAKFSSCLYGPFRESCKSNYPKNKTRSQQLPIGSKSLPLRAISRDIEQGSDFIIVKPGSLYADVISSAKTDIAKHIPIVGYQVSGEYAMLYYASEKGVFNLKKAVLESIVCLKRAGCSAIISYFTPKILSWIKT